jgi:hypothetical protein
MGNDPVGSVGRYLGLFARVIAQLPSLDEGHCFASLGREGGAETVTGPCFDPGEVTFLSAELFDDFLAGAAACFGALGCGMSFTGGRVGCRGGDAVGCFTAGACEGDFGRPGGLGAWPWTFERSGTICSFSFASSCSRFVKSFFTVGQ